MNTQTIVRYGLILSGFINISAVLLFSLFFTNSHISQIQPDVMSTFGLVMIMIWGLTYILVASKIQFVPLVLLAFAVEKLAYVVVWAIWWKDHSNQWIDIFQKDMFSGAFQILYGINDVAWLFFFLWAYAKLKK